MFAAAASVTAPMALTLEPVTDADFTFFDTKQSINTESSSTTMMMTKSLGQTDVKSGGVVFGVAAGGGGGGERGAASGGNVDGSDSPFVVTSILGHRPDPKLSVADAYRMQSWSHGYEYLTLWQDGTKSWEPYRNFVDRHDSTLITAALADYLKMPPTISSDEVDMQLTDMTKKPTMLVGLIVESDSDVKQYQPIIGTLSTTRPHLAICESTILKWTDGKAVPSMDIGVAILHGTAKRPTGTLSTIAGPAPIDRALAFMRACDHLFLLQCYSSPDMIPGMLSFLERDQSNQQIILIDSYFCSFEAGACVYLVLHAISQMVSSPIPSIDQVCTSLAKSLGLQFRLWLVSRQRGACLFSSYLQSACPVCGHHHVQCSNKCSNCQFVFDTILL